MEHRRLALHAACFALATALLHHVLFSFFEEKIAFLSSCLSLPPISFPARDMYLTQDNINILICLHKVGCADGLATGKYV